MKTRNNLLAKGALLALALGALSVPLLAQENNQGMVNFGKKGEIVFDSPVRVGDQLLKEGPLPNPACDGRPGSRHRVQEDVA